MCCGRNTAESCRKWSKSTGEYDYIDACWSSCALCSDDAYKILNTPVVYNEKIIDPELLLPLDAELLYYSIQSAKRQQEEQQKSSSKSISVQQPQRTENEQDNPVPFTVNKKDLNESPLILQNQESNMQSETFNIPSQEQPPVISSIAVKEASVDKSKDPPKAKSSKPIKAKKSAQSVKKKTKKNSRKKPTKKSRRSKSRSKKKATQSRSRSKRKSRSKTKT